MKNIFCVLLICQFVFLGIGCGEDDDGNPPDGTPGRNFGMGFTTWPYAATQQAVDDTYAFIGNNADIYVEHVDNSIPWNAWINGLALPSEFTNEITGKAGKKIAGKKLLLSVSLLNSNRDDLATDFDGATPSYTRLDDAPIQEAYYKHIDYLVGQFSPDYLAIAIEVNELLLRSSDKWAGYEALMDNVRARVKQAYPNLAISESITLHNLYEPDTGQPEAYIDQVVRRMNQMDFVAISYYPFLKNQRTAEDIQRAFDFLHARATRPIAFVETGQIAENLVVPNLNVSIDGSAQSQTVYLNTLLANAQAQDYEFVAWWTHRDYDALWASFPPEAKDLGQLWRDTGLLDENGAERPAMAAWKNIFSP